MENITEENVIINSNINEHSNDEHSDDEHSDDEYSDDEIEREITDIKSLFYSAKHNEDFDIILDKYNIQIKKKNQFISCKNEKLDIKKKVIIMRFNEPQDIFDFDYYDIKTLFNSAKYKKDFDYILDKYNIKIKKNNKLLSCKYQKLDIKKKVISMKLKKYDEIFVLNLFSKETNTK